MKADELKALAEKFRTVSAVYKDIAAVADEALAAHPGDREVADLCARMKAVTTADEAAKVCDEFKQVPPAEAKAAEKHPEKSGRHP